MQDDRVESAVSRQLGSEKEYLWNTGLVASKRIQVGYVGDRPRRICGGQAYFANGEGRGTVSADG